MLSTALRLCPLLLLLFAAHLGSAAVLKKRADKSGLLSREKSPMGSYLVNGSACILCKEDEYNQYPNDFPKCLGCRTCREDQVELSPCTCTRNTQCACKNGTFCLPDHPCEMCQKCQTRCPKGEVKIAPCTQHSDLKCGPPLDTSSSFPTSIVIAGALLTVFLGSLLLVLWRCYCNHHGTGNGGELSRKPSAVVEMPLRTSNPNVEAWRKLVPVPGEDPIVLLRRSFNTFVNCVPFPEWKTFGRALDLTENDIYLAEQHDRCSREPFIQMLNTWLNRQGSNASVNMLLETLPLIGLGGVADEVASKLVKEGYFQYKVS